MIQQIPAEFPIVGIGASAGGLDAFHSFLDKLPADNGMAFVMILHLPAGRKSMLIEILSRWTAMPVVEAVDGVQIEVNHIYVPAPHAVVTLVDRALRVQSSLADVDRQFRPIDGFFDSLGAAMRERAVGIVLSGTGSDGALGLKAIKECGGLTIAQGSNGTAPQYGEMPAGAIATGAVDIIAPVEDIPGHLLRLRALPRTLVTDEDDSDRTETERIVICDILRTRLGHDFSGYRRQTFLRRVERRMQVQNVTTLPEYIDKLHSDADEAQHLFRDLLIRVTSFFRDQNTFHALATKVIPKLFEEKMADGTVRLWIPGCATGEEAYSLAILLREFMTGLGALPKVQIFATDIDESSIATARLGRYPKTLLDGLSDERRERFFSLSQGGYSVTKEIRDLCTFSMHNVIRDPPFSMMNLVSCRNLLIYMNPELQARIIPVFHYALVPGGILLLGGSESVSQHENLFETVDKAARIFQRRQGRSLELTLHWPRSPVTDTAQPRPDGRAVEHSRQINAAHRSQEMFSYGRSDRTDSLESSRFEHLLSPQASSDALVSQLQSSLSGVCEELQSLTEEHQTALEELRSANEELHSVNEEMQSTNEELETSKEELQSVNEELQTVNFRLTDKIDELDHTNSDLRNLFDSTDIATVFLDRHLVIRSFTPAIATLYNLIPSDQGRPLTDIASQLRYPSLREDVAYVLSAVEPLERRVVKGDRSAHYLLRILPYREPDSIVSGVLITFVDVTSIVKAEEALVAADVRKDVFLATLSHELRNPLAPIRIASQLLRSPTLDQGALKHAQEIISRQVGHMSSLLDDLLDVSRITRGAFSLKKEYVEVERLFEDAVEAVEASISEKQHTVRVEPPAIPVTLEVDPVRITQVITNLLTNAVKYTPRGGLIHMGTRFEAQHLVIFVNDNGVGLSPESVETIFDMFTRVDSEIGRVEGGLGIGLALAKGLMELHGGRLRVHSAGRGKGSEFMLCIPRTLISQSATPHTAQPSGSPAKVLERRILLADDNRDNADTMAMLLELSGHRVNVARNGAEAIQLAQELRPEIGIFDIGMPDMSGYAVAERIRREAWGKQMILIAVTGWGQESDKRKALAAGFDHHLTKPVDPDKLTSLF